MKTDEVKITIPKGTKLIITFGHALGGIEEEEVAVYNEGTKMRICVKPTEGRTMTQTKGGMTCEFLG